jgi:hypothetical protein
MRRVLRMCAGAAVLFALAGVHVSAAGAQGIISGVTLPPVSAVTPGMPIGVAVSVPIMVTQPIVPGVSAGMPGPGAEGGDHVTHTETRTSEPATIELSE